MNDAEYIADRFNDIITRCDPDGRPTNLPHAERLIYYVVAVRCEMDMNGFESVFDQLLTKAELEYFTGVMGELEESELALAFQDARILLDDAGFFDQPASATYDLPQLVRDRLEQVEDRVRLEERLWELDSKLAALDRGA